MELALIYIGIDSRWVSDIGEESGMILMMIRSLTGYSVSDLDTLRDRIEGLKRYEQEEDMLVLYLDQVS